MTKTKRVLLISYHYPPSAAVGGLRIFNFARYLPDADWTPYVLTIDKKYIESANGQGKEEQEGVKVYRTFKLPKLFHALLATRNKLRAVASFVRKPAHKPAAVSGGNVKPQKQEGLSESLPDKMKRYFASLFLALPDGDRNWVLPAAIKALRLIRKEKIDCIVTSCPPYSVHLVGLVIHLFTGINWVVDFRDPWYIASQKRLMPTCKLSRAIEARLERAIVRRAKLVVTNTDKLRRALKDAYTSELPDKFVHIPNGIARSTFDKMEHVGKYDSFTLTYAGSLYFFRTPEPIFKAIRDLIDTHEIDESDIHIKLVGNCATIDGRPTEALIREYGLEGEVEVIPPVPYMSALEMVKKSHLALLFAPDQPYQIPAKVYDYMGTGTKMLAIANEGATSELIGDTNSGRTFVPQDIDGIKAFIKAEMGDMGKASFITTQHEMLLDRFDYRKITGMLAEQMRRVAG